jgi:hypothetical protein
MSFNSSSLELKDFKKTKVHLGWTFVDAWAALRNLKV